MQLEQQETFEIKSPQLEVFGQVESKLPAPAKKRPFAAGFLAVMVLVSVFGIGGVQLKAVTAMWLKFTPARLTSTETASRGILPP